MSKKVTPYNPKYSGSESRKKESSDDLSNLSQGEQIKEIVEENLRLTKEIHEMTTKVRRYVVVARIFSILKILLIVVPIVLGILYLPPLMNNLIDKYKDFLGLGDNISIEDLNGNQVNVENIDLNNLNPEAKSKILNFLK